MPRAFAQNLTLPCHQLHHSDKQKQKTEYDFNAKQKKKQVKCFWDDVKTK